jgi:hypothetical protein
MSRYSFKSCFPCAYQDSFSWFYRCNFGDFHAAVPGCRGPSWFFCQLCSHPPIRNLHPWLIDHFLHYFPHLLSCFHCSIHSMDQFAWGEPWCSPLHNFCSCCCSFVSEYWACWAPSISSPVPCPEWYAAGVSFLVTCGRNHRGAATHKRSIGPQYSSIHSQNLGSQSCSWFICLNLPAPGT